MLEKGGGDYMLSVAALRWSWNHYLWDHRDADNPYAVPMRARDLSALPPALVITAEYDPLRDEAEEYADKLAAAGVKVDVRRYPGMIHAFLGMIGVVDQATVALDEFAEALRAALHPSH